MEKSFANFAKKSKTNFLADGYKLDAYLSSSAIKIFHKKFSDKLVVTVVIFKDRDIKTWMGNYLFISDLVPLATYPIGHGTENSWLVLKLEPSSYLRHKGEEDSVGLIKLEDYKEIDDVYEYIITQTDKSLDFAEKDGLITKYAEDEMRLKKIDYLKSIAKDFQNFNNENEDVSEKNFYNLLKFRFPKAIVKNDYLHNIKSASHYAHSYLGFEDMFKKTYEKSLRVDVSIKNKFILYYAYRLSISSGDELIDAQINNLSYDERATKKMYSLYSTFQTFIEKQYESLL